MLDSTNVVQEANVRQTNVGQDKRRAGQTLDSANVFKEDTRKTVERRTG